MRVQGQGCSGEWFDASAVPAAVVTTDGVLVSANRSLVVLLGWDPTARRLDDLVHPEDRARIRFGAEGLAGVAVRARSRDGRSLDVDLFAVPVGAAGGEGRVLVQLVDRRRDRERERAIMELANTDDLTGLLNRRGFRTASEQLLALARRDGHEVTFLFLDVDGLKAINDRDGHAAGDDAIKRTADMLREAFRQADAIGRHGGDEFCVLALTRGPESAEHLRARLDAMISDRGARTEDEVPLSVSIGHVHHEATEIRSVDELIAEADNAMYEQRRRLA